MKLSQSLIKEILKPDHCPKQIFYSFVDGKELICPSENMKLGRYFETELLGSCRGGEKQEAKMVKDGISKPYADCKELVDFAKEVFERLGIDIFKGESQVYIESEHLSGNIDHINSDIQIPSTKALYDVKWTATDEDDRWNGWADPESKQDAIIQAVHYSLLYFEKYGQFIPFYFLVFGKSRWVKVIQFKITKWRLEKYKETLADASQTIRMYANENYKGNGSFNKCLACPFYDICPDKAEKINIETYNI